MGVARITVDEFTCERCGYAWIARVVPASQQPARCAKCKSPYWNSPRKPKPGDKPKLKKTRRISTRPKPRAPETKQKPKPEPVLVAAGGDRGEVSRHCKLGACAGCSGCGHSCH